ncbi:MAG: ribose 5-phosphate isomerase B [Dethiobacteria bacterium]
MRVAFAGDHAGFPLKEAVKDHLLKKGLAVHDFGAYSQDAVDYPDLAFILARAVSGGEFRYGILFCGTGIGVSIAANKVPGIRAANCHDSFSARMARLHNDANILTLGARVIGFGLATEIVDIFLSTEFEGGRHSRRLLKIEAMEKKGYQD